MHAASVYKKFAVLFAFFWCETITKAKGELSCRLYFASFF